MAQSGNRYVEIIQTQYGVRPADISVGRSMYLGGTKLQINPVPVPQTNSSSGSGATLQAQGQLAAYGYGYQEPSYAFEGHFDQHGYIIPIMFARTRQTYSQGIHRF